MTTTTLGATQILRDEHQLILSVIGALKVAAARLETGERLPADDLGAMIDFIRHFADGCHHAKEEGVLFPAMEAAGFARDGGPIGVMLQEHAVGRNLVRGMDTALTLYQGGDRAAAWEFAENARGYTSLLEHHIMKEDRILFDMADQALDEAAQREVTAEFERIEREEIGAGVHERYHAVAERLAATYRP